jgi:hypothetical protein
MGMTREGGYVMTIKLVHDADSESHLNLLYNRHSELASTIADAIFMRMPDDVSDDEALRAIIAAAFDVLDQRDISKAEIMAEVAEPWWTR